MRRQPQMRRHCRELSIVPQHLGGQPGIHSDREQVDVGRRLQQLVILPRWKRKEISPARWHEYIADAKCRAARHDEVQLGFGMKVQRPPASVLPRELPNMCKVPASGGEKGLEVTPVAEITHVQVYRAAVNSTSLGPMCPRFHKKCELGLKRRILPKSFFTHS